MVKNINKIKQPEGWFYKKYASLHIDNYIFIDLSNQIKK